MEQRTPQELMYDVCVAIAVKAHKGQFRHDGKTPYLEHPLALANAFTSWKDKCVAVLHDACEDGMGNDVDLPYIEDVLGPFKEYHFADVEYIIVGVLQLTHWPEDSYDSYIRTMLPAYHKFKIMDIVLNLTDNPSDRQKLKYKNAMKIIVDGMN